MHKYSQFLLRIKAQVLASEVYQRDSIDYQARVLGMVKTSIGDTKIIEKYTESIASVTAKQVREVARKYLVPNLKTVVKMLGLIVNFFLILN